MKIKSKFLRVLPVVGLLAFVATFSTANALQNIHSFDIAAQPLSKALLKFAEQSDIVVTIPTELVDGKSSPQVVGDMSPEQALEKLLGGSGLKYEKGQYGGVTITLSQVFVEDNASAGDKQRSEVKPRIIEEIVVTAEKRAESVMDIPIAISAFSGDTMERASVLSMQDLQRIAPSLQFGSRGDPTITMRGVGQVVRGIGAESGVQISVNGVPLSTVTLFDVNFLDVERVEVLRGPQGTISGRNATGGAINIHAARPTEEVGGRIKATLGSYSRFGTEGYLNGPIGETGILSRFAFRINREDGWLENVLLDEDVLGSDEQQFRASFLAPLSDAVEAHLVLEAQKIREADDIFVEKGRRRLDTPTANESAGSPANDIEDLKVFLNHSEKVDSEGFSAMLNLAWDISPTSRLTSTTGYIWSDTDVDDLDSDGGGADLYVISFVDFDIRQLSQELTYSADLTDRLDVILGAMYLHSETEEPIDIGLKLVGINPGDLQMFPEQKATSYAVYTQWRYRLTNELRVSLGGRYTHDKKSFYRSDLWKGGELGPQEASASWGAFTPRLALEYTPTEDLTLYASASRGYKSGGYDTFAEYGSPIADKFDPEFVWSYEAGAKALWFDRRLRTGLSAFYMDYTKFQASTLRPGVAGAFRNVENAAAATVMGLELELEAQLTDEFRLSAAGTWLDATFDSYLSDDQINPELNDPVTGVRDLSGVRLPRAPRWQFNVSGEYTSPVGAGLLGILRADYQWQDRQFFDTFARSTFEEGSYGVLNLHAALETEDGSWQLATFARNILDERYFADMTEGSTPKNAKGAIGLPRMYGVSVTYNF